MNLENSKNQKIQSLRAIAICAVVIIHSYPQTFFGIFVRSFVNFAVCLFFFVSGYLTKLDYDNWFLFYKKRIKRVVIPYLFWAIMWTIIKLVFHKAGDHPLLDVLTGNCLYPYYFVFVYVQFVLTTPLISRLIKSRFRFIGWIIQLLSIVILWYFGYRRYIHISLLFDWFSPYYLGMILGNHVQEYSLSYKKTIVLWFVTLCISIGEGLIWNSLGNYRLATTQRCLSNCAYSIICLLLAYKYIKDDRIKIRDNLIYRTLILLGDYSFGIFLTHAFIIMILKRLPVYKYLVFPINSMIIIAITAFCIFSGRKILGKSLGKYVGLY